MSARTVLLVATLLAGSGAAWALWPASSERAASGTEKHAGPRRSTVAGEGEAPSDTDRAAALAARKSEARAAFAEQKFQMLEALAAEQRLTDEQYDRLATALDAELTEGAAILDARRPAPGRPPVGGREIAEQMAAVKARADATAREVLTPEQLAAWEAARKPPAGFGSRRPSDAAAARQGAAPVEGEAAE